jgi:hypothetical protein
LAPRRDPVKDEQMPQRGRSSVPFADLVKAGHIKAGQTLVFRKDGPRAEVTADGAIRFQGKNYTSPSTAGRAAAGGTSTNGWTSWYVKEGGGLTLLSAIRARHTRQ